MFGRFKCFLSACRFPNPASPDYVFLHFHKVSRAKVSDGGRCVYCFIEASLAVIKRAGYCPENKSRLALGVTSSL